MSHVVSWVDIPAIDFNRAMKFYEAILSTPLKEDKDYPGVAVFPHNHEAHEVSGCIYDAAKADAMKEEKDIDHKPSATGILVYLNVKDLDKVITLIEAHGGKIINQEPMSAWGKRAVILDSEGNRIALFEPKK